MALSSLYNLCLFVASLVNKHTGFSQTMSLHTKKSSSEFACANTPAVYMVENREKAFYFQFLRAEKHIYLTQNFIWINLQNPR